MTTARDDARRLLTATLLEAGCSRPNPDTTHTLSALYSHPELLARMAREARVEAGPAAHDETPLEVQ